MFAAQRRPCSTRRARPADRRRGTRRSARARSCKAFSVRAESGKQACATAGRRPAAAAAAGGLFQHHVRIAAAEAEGADARQSRLGRFGPGFQLLRRPATARCRRGCRDWACGSANWAATADASGPRRPSSGWPCRRPLPCGRYWSSPSRWRSGCPAGRPSREHAAQGQGLDGVAQRRAGALGFHVLHLPRRNLGPGVGLAQHLLLRRRGWGRSGRCWCRSG